MGTIYSILNKTKRLSIDLDSKYSELINNDSKFLAWLMFEWQGDYIVLVSDNNSYEYPEEYLKAHDVTETMMKDYGLSSFTK